jgi:hypothetical protein
MVVNDLYVLASTSMTKNLGEFVQKKTRQGEFTADYLSHCTPSAGDYII